MGEGVDVSSRSVKTLLRHHSVDCDRSGVIFRSLLLLQWLFRSILIREGRLDCADAHATALALPDDVGHAQRDISIGREILLSDLAGKIEHYDKVSQYVLLQTTPAECCHKSSGLVTATSKKFF